MYIRRECLCYDFQFNLSTKNYIRQASAFFRQRLSVCWYQSFWFRLFAYSWEHFTSEFFILYHFIILKLIWLLKQKVSSCIIPNRKSFEKLSHYVTKVHQTLSVNVLYSKLKNLNAFHATLDMYLFCFIS